jgi:rhodanese-related sulfurtransferase
MRYSVYILFVLLILNGDLMAQYKKTASCSQPAFDAKVNSYLKYTAPVISTRDAYAHKSSYIFLDAREIQEYQTSHIPEARYVGYEDFNIKSIQDISKDKKIIVYCSIGYRSERIATQLRKAGYKNVFNLYGSLFEWVNEGYSTYDKHGKPTKKIHTYSEDWGKWVFAKDAVKVW